MKYREYRMLQGRKRGMRYDVAVLVAVMTTLGCGDNKEDGAQDGSETGPCYANGTCNSGLECLSDVCVDARGDSREVESKPEPVCRSVDLINGTAVEKVNAAMCFTLAFDGAFACRYDVTADVTHCGSGKIGFYVTHRETQGGTVGDVYDQFDDTHIGRVRQSSTGLFDLEFYLDPPRTGSCSVTGDIATLCTEPKGG